MEGFFLFLVSNSWFLISMGIPLIFDSNNSQYLNIRDGTSNRLVYFPTMPWNPVWQQLFTWPLSGIFVLFSTTSDHKNQSRLQLLKVLHSPEAPEKTKSLSYQRLLLFLSCGTTPENKVFLFFTPSLGLGIPQSSHCSPLLFRAQELLCSPPPVSLGAADSNCFGNPRAN